MNTEVCKSPENAKKKRGKKKKKVVGCTLRQHPLPASPCPSCRQAPCFPGPAAAPGTPWWHGEVTATLSSTFRCPKVHARSHGATNELLEIPEGSRPFPSAPPPRLCCRRAVRRACTSGWPAGSGEPSGDRRGPREGGAPFHAALGALGVTPWAGARPHRWYSSMMPAWCKLLHSSASSSMSWLA